MKIALLCGGLGTRITSLDNNLPKGMLNINGEPFISYLLKSLGKFNFESIHFCLGYKSEIYLDYLNNLEPKINFTFSIEEEGNLLGTGGAIKNSVNMIGDDNFIVQYGDTILNIDYDLLYKKHIESNKNMTMSILQSNLTEEKPNVYCEKVENQIIQCIYNKNNPMQNSNYIDYGALVFKKSVFLSNNKKVFDLSLEQERLTKLNQALFYEVYEPYIEIGTVSSYEKAIINLK